MKKLRNSPPDISVHLGDLTQLLTPYEGEAIPISDLRLSDLLSLPPIATTSAPHTDARCTITLD